MKVAVYTYTNQGGKPNNEDYLAYKENSQNSTFILADGLGGHSNGEVASKLVVDYLIERLEKECKVTSENLEQAFFSANEQLLKKQKEPEYGTMKTTVVVLHIEEEQALWGHIGDSRLYYLSDNEIAQVTNDHSVTFKKYRSGEITRRQMNEDEDRSSLLGVMGNKDKCIPEVISEPRELHGGDAFLLCSDGFWEYLYEDEILVDYLKSETPKEWAEYMLLRHIERTKPGNDNFSLITIMLE